MKKILLIIALFANGAINAISQTTPPVDPGEDKKPLATVLGKTIGTEQKDQLDGLIFGALLDQYAKDNGIEPTEAEIKLFLDYQESTSLNSLQKSESDKSQLEKELESRSLSAEQRKEKQSELEKVETDIRNQKETRVEAGKYEEQLRPMRRDMAIRQVKHFKINQVLFKKYGGRVIFQQAGVEPLDAYRDFLLEEQKKGRFTINDKDDEAAFWKYFTDDKTHTFFSSDEGPKMMEKPFWLMEEDATK